MKIAILSPYELPVPAVKGGAVESLVELFARNNEKEKIDLTIISRRDVQAISAAKGFESTHFIWNKYTLNNYATINRILRKIGLSWRYHPAVSRLRNLNEYDVLIVENCLAAILPVRRRFSGKLILHVHADNIRIGVPDVQDIVRACDGIFAVSKFIARRILDVAPMAPVKVLLNGVETDLYQLRSREKGSKSITMGYIGRLTEAKGVDKLLDAFIALKNVHKEWDLSLRIVGGSAFKEGKESEYITTLKEKARPYGRCITFTGFVEHSCINKEFAKCDIVVVPSQCNEALPLSVAGAMASGCLVVATRIGGIPEIQNNQRYLVEPSGDYVGDLIQTLEIAIDDIIQGKFAMDMARERIIKYFNGSSYLKNMVDLIENIEKQ